jgi:hypothetical protein
LNYNELIYSGSFDSISLCKLFAEINKGFGSLEGAQHFAASEFNDSFSDGQHHRNSSLISP